jgi:2',3'-cyclic-nucleotide 2'-phosphodiesterase (5'-nucleotidase family)
MNNKTDGRTAFENNIITMKLKGQENRAKKELAAKENQQRHLAQMEARKQIAAAEAERKRLEGINKRDQHNAQLRQARTSRLQETEELKTKSLRALG